MKAQTVLLPTLAATLFMGLSGAGPLAHRGKFDMTQFKSPTRITQTPAGEILVTDYHKNAVVKVDPADPNIILSGFWTMGNANGIAATDEWIYVGNETFHRIDVYNHRGKFKTILGGRDMVVGDPTDLAIDHTRNLLFAVDAVEKNIKVFDISTRNGEFLYTISERGLEDHQLWLPAGIFVDPETQEVFVSDYGDVDEGPRPRVIIFGYDGSYKENISGKTGMMGYRYSKPQGLWVDPEKRIFILASWGGQAIVMDRATHYEIGRVGEYGTDPGQLFVPLDLIVVGEQRDVYITNSRNECIEFYPEGGQF